MRWCVLLCLLTTLWEFSFQSEDAIRLPDTIKPSHYDVKFITHLNDTPTPFKFYGEVIITFIAVKRTDEIVFHSKNLELLENKIKVYEVDTKEPVQIREQHAGSYDTYHLLLTDGLKAGTEYKLQIKYEGTLHDGLMGYYRSSYTDRATGQKKWLAVTQFEAIAAREAFPCFDEPALKAVFKITMGHDSKYTALSNMPLKKSTPMEDEPEWVWDEFEETVPMSSYIVAFALTDFAHKKSHGKIFRTWARKDAIEQCNFAKEYGPEALAFFEEFFNIKYVLPKVDQIAIPDFNSGAMENWGLVTYRETALLYDPSAVSQKAKQYVANVVSHELAHQWFGNLVTMKWWTDLWLNEGFATFMAATAVNNLYPEWHAMDNEITDNIMVVYDVDNLKSSHQISIPIKNPESISEIFDFISYKKGFFIIHMMNRFLQAHVFRKGVSNYLKKYKFRNAVQDDLWESLTEEGHAQGTLPTNMTVKEIMDPWTLQTGYPIITVERDCRSGEVSFAQERFLQRNILGDRDSQSCWYVPISYTTESELNFNDTTPQIWLSCEEREKTINMRCDNWLIVNIQASGLYVVNYDEQNWKMIIKTLKSKDYKDIHLMNRVVLIDNVLSLAKTGHVSYEIAFDLVSYLRHEEEHMPWRAAITKLTKISRLLASTPAFGEFKKFMQYLLTPIFNKLFNNPMYDDEIIGKDLTNFRQEIAERACHYDVGNCVSKAQKLFYEWKLSGGEKESPVPPSLRLAYYCAAIREGDEDDWDFLWEQYLKSNVIADKITILASLGCSNEPWILSRYLEWSLTEKSGIRKMDAINVFTAVVHNDMGYFVAKRFLKDKIRSVYKRTAPILNKMGQYAMHIVSHVSSEDDGKELTKFFEENDEYFKAAKLAVDQSVELISVNVHWYKKNKMTIHNTLIRMREAIMA